MKITKRQLRRLIREEAEAFIATPEFGSRDWVYTTISELSTGDRIKTLLGDGWDFFISLIHDKVEETDTGLWEAEEFVLREAIKLADEISMTGATEQSHGFDLGKAAAARVERELQIGWDDMMI